MKNLLTVILFAAVLMGCSSSYNYYMLKVEAPEALSVSKTSVGLIPVNIPGWLNDARLSWSDGEVSVYREEDARWGTDLGKEIDRALSGNLSQQLGGADISVGPWFGEQHPDLAVKVYVDNLIMSESVVEVVARWQLLDRKGKILVQSDEQAVWVAESGRENNGLRLAQGVSQALAGISTDIAEAVQNIEAKKMEL